MIRLHAQAGAEDTYKAVYDLNLQSIRKEDEPVIVPIMLAETRKNAEHKISQSVGTYDSWHAVFGYKLFFISCGLL